MYRNAYQRGMLTIFFSGGSAPLKMWDVHTQDGYVTQFLDQDIKAMVVDIRGTNVSTSYMVCPKGNQVLGISMPFLVMIVKNLKKYFTFEVTILDETGTRRRFRVANFQSTTQILPMSTVMPIGLSEGWNQIQFNLAEFTQRAYKKQFVEVQKLKINANIRIRRIYFCERLMPEEELPPEYRLFFPLSTKGKGKKEAESTEANQVKAEIIKGSKTAVEKVSSKDALKRASQEAVKEEPPPTAPAGSIVEGAPTEEKQPSSHAITEEGKTETPAEEIPAVETPVEETPADETPAAETPATETPGEVTPGGETPVEEAPGPEPPEEPQADQAATEGEPATEEAQAPAEG